MSDEVFSDRPLSRYQRSFSPARVAEYNRCRLQRYRDFRLAADAVVAAWRTHRDVLAVGLIGSVAKAPWKELPRSRLYRRKGIELWHDCKDLDLGLWLERLTDLNGLRRAKNRALTGLYKDSTVGIAAHQVDVFILEPDSGRYLGRLCQFNRCPKGKPDCLVEGCGETAFLRQHEGFEWFPETLAEVRMVLLFDRKAGLLRRAADLPMPHDDADPAD